MERAMQQDFSWKQAAEEYSTLYRRLVPISVAAVEPEPAAVI
jgi:glycogen synthase